MVPGAYVPRASVKFSVTCQAKTLLVYGADTAQPGENRLARPISSPLSNRRA